MLIELIEVTKALDFAKDDKDEQKEAAIRILKEKNRTRVLWIILVESSGLPRQRMLWSLLFTCDGRNAPTIQQKMIVRVLYIICKEWNSAKQLEESASPV